MSKLRISIVEYLNTAPLVWGFTDGPLAGKYDLSFTVPSQCAEALRRGDVDVAIIPSIEYQRIEGLVALPDMAVACDARSAQPSCRSEKAGGDGPHVRARHEFAQHRGAGKNPFEASLEDFAPSLSTPPPIQPPCWKMQMPRS